MNPATGELGYAMSGHTTAWSEQRVRLVRMEGVAPAAALLAVKGSVVFGETGIPGLPVGVIVGMHRQRTREGKSRRVGRSSILLLRESRRPYVPISM